MEVSQGSDFSRSVWISAQIRLMWTNPNYFEDIPSTSCRNNFVTLKCFVSYMRRCKSINKRTKERPYAQVQLVSLSSKLRRYIYWSGVKWRKVVWRIIDAYTYCDVSYLWLTSMAAVTGAQRQGISSNFLELLYPSKIFYDQSELWLGPTAAVSGA